MTTTTTKLNWAIFNAAGEVLQKFPSRDAARKAHAANPTKGNKVGQINHDIVPVADSFVEAEAQTKPVEVEAQTTQTKVVKTKLDALAVEIAKAPAKRVTLKTTTKKEKAPKPVTPPEVIEAAFIDLTNRLKTEKACPAIWAVLDAFPTILRPDFIALGVRAGLNKGTLGQQTYLWNKARNETKPVETQTDVGNE
jgi:hypothetical protein